MPESLSRSPYLRIPVHFDVESEYSGSEVRKILQESGLSTVCQSASCPNLAHCFSRGTATFLIMGDLCTRRCAFCDVKTAKPNPLDPEEPDKLALSVKSMKLKHAVITSVDRDDLPDCGASHFRDCISAVREHNPEIKIEVLIPDFKGRKQNLEVILQSPPDILAHNVETVPSFFKEICPQANYEVSLHVLRYYHEKGLITKSGLMLGFGETLEEVLKVMKDLFENGVQILTIGQYLRPSPKHAQVHRLVSEDEFLFLKKFGLDMGFRHIESGSLVRSSYHAGDVMESIL